MTEPSADYDRFLVELLVRRRVKKGRSRVTVEVTCAPKVSAPVMKEISASLPARTLAALPAGRYAFGQASLTGFSTEDFPEGTPEEHLAIVAAAMFRIMRRCHAQLVVLIEAMADKAVIEEVVDGMYESAINVVAETREVAKLEPGFLRVEVGPVPSAFVKYFEKGVDPATMETTNAYGYLVVPLEGTRFLGVVAVCPEEHAFAEYAVGAFTAVFEAVVRARERLAVKAAQRMIEQEIAELQADQETFARIFGALESDEHIVGVEYAEELRRAGGEMPEA